MLELEDTLSDSIKSDLSEFKFFTDLHRLNLAVEEGEVNNLLRKLPSSMYNGFSFTYYSDLWRTYRGPKLWKAGGISGLQDFHSALMKKCLTLFPECMFDNQPTGEEHKV